MAFEIGDPALLFQCKSTLHPETPLNSFGGSHTILFFFGTAKLEAVNHFIKLVETQLKPYLDKDNFTFLGVTIDPDDIAQNRIKAYKPGLHYLLDYDHKVSELYQTIAFDKTQQPAKMKYRQGIFIINPALRIIETIPFTSPESTMNNLINKVEQIKNQQVNTLMSSHAPILMVPGVFEKAFCKELIDAYDQNGGVESGFLTPKGEYFTREVDNSVKIRKDYNLRNDIKNKDLINRINYKINTRLVPEILKSFQFKVDYTERHIICCYDAETGGYFKPHRDNTHIGAVHRRFAVTINLNAEDYEGGDLRFPEYGANTYRGPTGGAVVFSCSLLHEALPVTAGKRYAFVPFLYEEAGEKLRLENLKYLV